MLRRLGLPWTGVGVPPAPDLNRFGPIDPRTCAAAHPLASVILPALTGKDPSTGRALMDVPTSEAGLPDIAEAMGERAGRTSLPRGVPG